MELDDEMKALLKNLGAALHKALTRDTQVKSITDEIKGNGFDIYLIMEANIALDRRESSDLFEATDPLEQIRPHIEFARTMEKKSDTHEVRYSQYDRDFLQSLQIQVDEESKEI